MTACLILLLGTIFVFASLPLCVCWSTETIQGPRVAGSSKDESVITVYLFLSSYSRLGFMQSSQSVLCCFFFFYFLLLANLAALSFSMAT